MKCYLVMFWIGQKHIEQDQESNGHHNNNEDCLFVDFQLLHDLDDLY